MADEPEIRPLTPVSTWLLGVVVALAAVGLIVVAWRGCTAEDPLTAAQREIEEKKKEEDAKKKLVDPRVDRLIVQPGEPESELQMVKPGHWATATQRMRAIYQDFVGESQTSIVNGRDEVVPGRRHAVRAANRRGRSRSRRVGPRTSRPRSSCRRSAGRCRCGPSWSSAASAGRCVRSSPVTRMPSYQYHFVILAKEPTRYALVKTLDSVRVPWDGESDADDTEDPVHYRVVSLDVERAISLSDNPLTWTSIAYVLWDEVDPQALHAGARAGAGRLAALGRAADRQRARFARLAEGLVLGAVSAGHQRRQPEDRRRRSCEPLNRRLDDSVHARRGRAAGADGAVVGRGTRVAAWRARARPLATTGGLLVERTVGRGRIVVSAMQLAERDLVNWRGGFESLFNACILRRPQRESIGPATSATSTLAWADPKLAEQRLDARLTTGLRYLARDLGVDTNYRFVDVTDPSGQSVADAGSSNADREYRPPEQVGGIGAWNDFSATANVAREALVGSGRRRGARHVVRRDLPGDVSGGAGAAQLAGVQRDRAGRMGVGRRADHCAWLGTLGDRGPGAARHRIRPRADGDRRVGAAARL